MQVIGCVLSKIKKYFYHPNKVKMGSAKNILFCLLLLPVIGGCGGGDESHEGRRYKLNIQTSSYDKDDLYRFFAIAFGAAPGITYMGQLLEAANSGLTVKEIVNIFTTKVQFTERYPNEMTDRDFAKKLVADVVGLSASDKSKEEASADIETALAVAKWSRGDVIYTIFSNLARKSTNDLQWGGTALKMSNQVKYSKYYTEVMKGDSVELGVLRSVIKYVDQFSATDLNIISSNVQSAIRDSGGNLLALASGKSYSTVATESIRVELQNWDPEQSTSVTLRVDGKNVDLSWRKVDNSKSTILITLPPQVIDAQLNTKSYTGVVEIAQKAGSVLVGVSVDDLPKLEDYGTQPGEITKAMLIAGIHLSARTTATLQAMRACDLCLNGAGLEVASLAKSISNREFAIERHIGLISAITSISQDEAVEITFSNIKNNGLKHTAVLNKDSLIFTDRIFGLMLMREIERKSTLDADRKRGLSVGSNQQASPVRSDHLGFKELAYAVFRKEVRALVEGAGNGVDYAINIFKINDAASGESSWMDRAKSLGSMLLGASVVAGAIGMAGISATVGAAAAPLLTASAVVGYGIGVVAGGDLLANAYDYTTTSNASVRAAAAQNMKDASWDVLGGALASVNIAKSIAEVRNLTVVTSNSTVNEVGTFLDSIMKVGSDFSGDDRVTANTLLGLSPALATIQVEPSGSAMANKTGQIRYELISESNPDKPIISLVGPAGAPSLISIPKGFADKSEMTLIARNVSDNTLVASRKISNEVLKGGVLVSLGSSCSLDGVYQGTFTGTSTGLVKVVITKDGNIQGGGQNDSGPSFSVAGKITSSGGFQASAGGGTSTGAAFNGRMTSSNSKWTIEGAWKNTFESGVFYVSKSCN